jgi:hypothetical protein
LAGMHAREGGGGRIAITGIWVLWVAANRDQNPILHAE